MEPLPQVVPLVMYTGEGRWRAPVAVEELVRGPFAPRFRFVLLDLSQTDDDALGPVGARRSALLLLKYARARTLWQRFVGWLPELKVVISGPRGIALFRAMWSYLRRASRHEPPPDVFVAMEVTLGAQIRQEAEGWGVRRERLARELGLEQGLERGREEGRVELLLRQFVARFGALPASVEARVRAASADEHDRWAIRLLTAPTLDDVFARE